MKELNGKKLHQGLTFAEKTDSSYLPSYWTSLASVFDLYGILLDDYLENFQNINDLEALKSDWERVGQDMKDVISRTQHSLAEQLNDGHDTALEDAMLDALDQVAAEIELDKVSEKKQNEQAKTAA